MVLSTSGQSPVESYSNQVSGESPLRPPSCEGSRPFVVLPRLPERTQRPFAELYIRTDLLSSGNRVQSLLISDFAQRRRSTPTNDPHRPEHSTGESRMSLRQVCTARQSLVLFDRKISPSQY